MVLDGIIENDLENSINIITNDKKINELDTQFYALLNNSNIDYSTKMELEEIFSAYSARTARLSFLCGFQSFYHMCISLDKKTEALIQMSEQLK